MIRKIIPFTVLVCCAIFTQIRHTELYKEIWHILPVTNGWGLLIMLGYFLTVVKCKEGIFAEVSCIGLIIMSLFELGVTVFNPAGKQNRQIIDIFDIGSTSVVIGIILVCLYFKSTREKLF